MFLKFLKVFFVKRVYILDCVIKYVWMFVVKRDDVVLEKDSRVNSKEMFFFENKE